MRSSKAQAEEAEQAAAANLVRYTRKVVLRTLLRYRRAQAEAEEADGRAGQAERLAGQIRGRSLGRGERRGD